MLSRKPTRHIYVRQAVSYPAHYLSSGRSYVGSPSFPTLPFASHHLATEAVRISVAVSHGSTSATSTWPCQRYEMCKTRKAVVKLRFAMR